MRTVKQLMFVLASIFVAALVARLATAPFIFRMRTGFNEATAFTVVVFVGVFLVTFTGLLLAGMAHLLDTSLTRHEKQSPDQISWRWY